MLLQHPLVHLALGLLQKGQCPALHGGYVVLPQHPGHQPVHLVVAIAHQHADLRSIVNIPASHGDPSFTNMILNI